MSGVQAYLFHNYSSLWAKPRLCLLTHISWSKLVGSESDWNIETEPSPGANNRRIKATRAKFLGGSSGINGTLCIRGTKQDYDDWNLDGWSGEEVFANMRKVSFNWGASTTRAD